MCTRARERPAIDAVDLRTFKRNRKQSKRRDPSTSLEHPENQGVKPCRKPIVAPACSLGAASAPGCDVVRCYKYSVLCVVQCIRRGRIVLKCDVRIFKRDLSI